MNAQLQKMSGKPLPAEVLDPAFASVRCLDDPLAATLRAQADHAVAAGLLDKPDLSGIYDLRPLNRTSRPPASPRPPTPASASADRTRPHAQEVTTMAITLTTARAEDRTAVEYAARLEHVSKSFAGPAGQQLVLDDISLDVAPGEFVTLLGASGCGKSTLLNLVAASTGRPRAPSPPTAARR